MLREFLRPRPESRSKGLVKQQDPDSFNFISQHSTHPVSYVHNSSHTNSKKAGESINPNLSIKPNSNATNHSNSNNNIITESYCLPSSYSIKDKTNSIGNAPYTINRSFIDSIALNNNVNLNIHQVTSDEIKNYDSKNQYMNTKSTNKTKDDPKMEYSNTIQSPLSATKYRSSSHSTNKLQRLEACINQIKYNVYEKSKPLITSKSKAKDQLQNNVDIIVSNLRTIHRETKVNGQLNKEILKENERLVSSGERAVRDTYFTNKELPLLSNEIEDMKTLIAQHNEESRYIRNDSIQIEREILLMKDEIKKMNGQISLILKEKEKFCNAIVVVNKHIETMKDKIQKQDRLSDELMCSVQALVDQSSHVYDYMKL